MPMLSLEGVTKSYGPARVIEGVSLTAEPGEFLVFVGPSGCGKSTLLRMIAGLEEVSGGRIDIDGRDVTRVSPAQRQVAMVFQSYALYPHMTVFENIAFGLKLSKVPPAEIRAQVDAAARILQIGPLLDRTPRQLSGGQRQRVAIGRAIVRQPKLFLFDEPLSNLDAELRAQMRVEIARLHRDLGVSMVYVTHDQVEAMTLADRIVALRAGKVEQIGSPTELYDHPANLFVAGFIGSPRMNFLTGMAAGGGPDHVVVAHPALAGGQVSVPVRRAVAAGEPVTLGLRPETLRIGAGVPVLTVTAEFAEKLGGATQLHAGTMRGEMVSALIPARVEVARGETLTLGLTEGRIHAFDTAGLAL